MKKHGFIKIAALLVLCSVMVGCGKEEPQSSQTTTIYGTVFDSESHEPLIGVQIEVGHAYSSSSPDFRISSSVSGTDGQFELQFGEVQIPSSHSFYLKATADNYYEFYQFTGIVIGSNYRMDINLIPR